MLAVGYGAHAPCGWFAPTYRILLDAWESMKRLFGPFIAEVHEADYKIVFHGGGSVEFWSLDGAVVARSRGYKLVVIDEAGLVQKLSERWRADIEPTLLDQNGRALFLSTPNQIGPDFVRFFRLGVPHNPEWASFQWSSLDNPYLQSDVAAHIERLRAQGVPEWLIRQEYFAEEAGHDTRFFPEPMIVAYKARHGLEPLCRGSLVVPLRQVGERDAVLTHRQMRHIEWHEDGRGPWKLWCDVDDDGYPLARSERTCMAVDIGCGVGSSNSVISVGDSDTNEKWAEYAWPGDSPEELARIAVAFGLWAGVPGAQARLNFEANGPGEQFIKVVRQLEYPNIHTNPRSAVKRSVTPDERYGWWNTQQAKFSMFSEYRSALTTGGIINPSIPALDECLRYFQEGPSKVVHETEMGSGVDPETMARIPHGDRAVADALLHQAMQANPVSVIAQPDPPRGSFAARQIEVEREEEAEESGSGHGEW